MAENDKDTPTTHMPIDLPAKGSAKPAQLHPALLRMPENIHPGAKVKYMEMAQDMGNVIEAQKTEQDRGAYANYFNQYLNEYVKYTNKTEQELNKSVNDYARRTGGTPMPTDALLSIVKSKANQFGFYFNTRVMPALEQQLDSSSPDINYDGSGNYGTAPKAISPVRKAFNELARERRGPGMIESVIDLVYDHDKVPEDVTKSTDYLKGINFGGIAGGIAGFMAGGAFAPGGIMGILIRGIVAIGGAFGGKMVQDWVVGDSGDKTTNTNYAPKYTGKAETREAGSLPSIALKHDPYSVTHNNPMLPKLKGATIPGAETSNNPGAAAAATFGGGMAFDSKYDNPQQTGAQGNFQGGINPGESRYYQPNYPCNNYRGSEATPSKDKGFEATDVTPEETEYASSQLSAPSTPMVASNDRPGKGESNSRA